MSDSTYNARLRLYDHLCALISADATAKLEELDPSDRVGYEQIMCERNEELRSLRKWYFGRKNEEHCTDCRFYEAVCNRYERM